jgi:hypothetical protein
MDINTIEFDGNGDAENDLARLWTNAPLGMRGRIAGLPCRSSLAVLLKRNEWSAAASSGRYQMDEDSGGRVPTD